MKCFEDEPKLLTIIAVLNDGDVTLTECIKAGNGAGWWFMGDVYQIKRGTRWMFIKMADKQAISQDDYTMNKKPVCCPPRVYRKDQQPA